MTDASRETRHWWANRRLRLFLFAGLLVVLLAAALFDRWAGRRVEVELARLESRYGSLDGRSIVAPPVAAEYNSARFVRAAAALVMRDRPYGALLTSLTAFEKLPPGSAVPDNLQAFLDANRDAVRLADEARSRHQASWEATYGLNDGANMPRLLDIRTLSNAIHFAADLDTHAGRAEDASRKVASGLAVGASLRQEPSLIAQLIRIVVATEQCEAVERLITQAEPSKASLEELARSLVENRQTDPIRIGLIGELRHGNAALIRMEGGQVTNLSEFDGDVSGWLVGRIGRLGRPFVRLARMHYLKEMERLLEIQSGPRPRPAFTAPVRPRRWDWRRLSYAFSAGLERAIGSGDLYNSALGTTELAVALRRYRIDHQTYPAVLSALVPGYVSRLPLDPVTGRPPSYARSGAGFTLKAEPIGSSTSPNTALDWSVSR